MDGKWTGNQEIFRTYVRGRSDGDGKRPAERVKDRDHISDFSEVCGEPCFGGILNPGFVDISFDTREMYEAFLSMAEANGWRCLALPSPKGGHTYWRDRQKRTTNGRDRKLAVGLVADIHSGSTYIPLKVHGKERFPPDYDKLPEEAYQEVPDELMPVDTSAVLWGMGNGDGRNDTLYKYILVLQSQLRLSQQRIRGVIMNANRFVLAEPLPEAEMDTVLRDGAFQKPSFFDGTKFLHNEFGDWLMKEHHIRSINNQLHAYVDGVYIPGNQTIEHIMLEEIPQLRDTQRKEVLKYMQVQAAARKEQAAHPRYIAFRNGVLDVFDGTMLPFSPSLLVTNQIPWDYDPGAECELVDRTLDGMACGDADIRALLEECVGYCFFRGNELRKAFILTGGRRGGKSTFLECVKTVLGKANTSFLDISELSDRFNTATMFGKLANIGDDIGDEFLRGSQVAIFKKVVAGNTVKAEWKGMDPFDFDPYVKLLFSANEIPRMRDRGGAVIDRLIIIPFNATFEQGREGYDPFLKHRLKEPEAVKRLVRLGVEGLRRVLADNRGFTVSSRVAEQMEEYNELNNPVLGFIREVDVEADVLNVPCRDVYRRYTVYCDENGVTPLGNKAFTRQLNEALGTVTRQIRTKDKRVRIFERAEG